VRGKRVVGRLEGRSTAPKIEALLREHLVERDLEPLTH
jgi:hypothetical protein